MEDSGLQNHVPGERLVKCLGYLIVIRFASVALSLVSMLPVVGGYAELISGLPSAALAVVLWLLGSEHNRYRKAAMLYGVSLAIGCVVYLIGRINAAGELGWQLNDAATYVTFGASVCSFLAMYQEYNAHGEVIEPVDKNVSRKWEQLFGWQVAYLLAAYILNFALIAVLFVFPVILEVYAWAVELVNLVIAWCYIRNLKAMCCSIQNMG